MRRLAVLLSGTVLTPTVLILPAIMVAGWSGTAFADGGAGGGSFFGGAGGAGGSGPNGGAGQPGQYQGFFQEGGGGGGGGAGGGTGGAGGPGAGGATGGAGGAGGTGTAPGLRNGSNGSPGVAAATGGGGGGGGFNGFDGAALNNAASLIGGNGGTGGDGASAGSGDGGSGGGGSGGYGANVTTSGNHTNSGTISGGTGGAGGYSHYGRGGSGGDGGIGVFFGAAGSTLQNDSAINGGSGGIGGRGVQVNGNPGAGGAGVVGSGLTITNSGTIAGGLSGNGVRANAVTFTGGANTLIFENTTSGLTGNIGILAGNLTFNQNNGIDVTVGNAITGAGSVVKSGGNLVVFSGANIYTGTTGVNAGILRAGAANTFSASSAHTVASGTTLDLNSFNQTIGSLAGAGQITLGSATLTAGGDNSSTAFSGIMSGGPGALGTAFIKEGTGTLTLSGANTYTGRTQISGGTLRAGAANIFVTSSAHSVASGATLDLNGFSQTIGSLASAGNVTLGSATLTAGGDNSSSTFSGIISGGPGTQNTALIKEGTGTLTLSGANTYTGRTMISTGTLQAGAANTFSASGAHSISAGATLDLNGFNQTISSIAGMGNITLGSAKLTLAGLPSLASASFLGGISGSGELTKEGTFAQVLSGANTYHGTTHVNSGALVANGVNTFSSNSAHVVAATLNLNGYNQTIGSLAGAGNVSLGSASLTSGGDNSSTTFSGAMSGFGGFTKQGTGTQTFSGTNTYFGATNVNDGGLMVHESLTQSNTTVNANGVFGGTGQVRDVTVNGGVFAPGNGAAGTQMTVNGNLSFSGGGIYRIFADPTAASSAIVNGTANLSGGTVEAQFAAGSYLTRQYTILSASGGLGGTQFTGLNGSLSGFRTTLVYQGNDVILDMLGSIGVGGNLSGNQQTVATSLNTYFNNGGTLPPEFVALFGKTGDALNAALSQTSGESSASVSSATFLAWQQFFNMIFDPFAENRTGFGGSSAFASTPDNQSDAVRLAYAAVASRGGLKNDVTPDTFFEQRWRVWGGGYGGSAKTGGNPSLGSHDTNNRAYGFAAGADHRLTPDTMIGFALAGGGTSFGLSQGLGGGTSDMFQASIYARQNWGAGYLMGAFGYGWQDFTLKRSVSVVGIDNLQADFNGHTLAGRTEAGWRFGSAFAGMTPYGALQIVSLDLPFYSERATSGANAFALSYSGRTDTQTRSELGARFDYATPMQDALLTLRGRTAWAHDYGDNRTANAGFLALPGTAFAVNGATPDKDSLLVSAGAELAFRNGVSIAGSFEGEVSGNTQSYAGKGAFRYRW